MSWIMPPRPKRARRPVMVKSVSTSTWVTSPSALIVLTIVALADPWPRLSCPLARMVTRCAASSSSSTFSSPR